MRRKLFFLLFAACVLPKEGHCSSQTFTSSGTWVAPSGVTTVQVECWAGGGSGGLGSPVGQTIAAGGGGGAYAKANAASVTPGNTYNVHVGAGGPGGSDNIATTGPGDDSWFGDATSTTAFAAHGLVGGNGAAGAAGAGGLASASTGDVKFSGGNGAQGTGGVNGGGGGSGGGTGSDGNNASGQTAGAAVTGGGAGGNGGGVGTPGVDGSFTGGGGGGKGTGTPVAHGSGGFGQITLTWTAGATTTNPPRRRVMIVE